MAAVVAVIKLMDTQSSTTAFKKTRLHQPSKNGWDSNTDYSQSHLALQQIPATTLFNFACDRLALNRDISFGWLTSPNVWRYIPIES